jgi:mannose-6-phosphate isomerase-like protein (cupin superfamily)
LLLIQQKNTRMKMNHNQHQRRKFLQTGVMSAIAAFFTSLPKINFAQSIVGNDKGIVIQEDEGTKILTGRRKAPMNIKISKVKTGVTAISFCTEDIVPGRNVRIHKHLYNDEFIFISNGEGIFTLDEQTIAVKTGTVIFVPRGVWHGLENTSKETMRMNFGYTPSGFEEYFIENGNPVGAPPKERSLEEYALAEKKYGMVY